jgi:hypothetical protein
MAFATKTAGRWRVPHAPVANQSGMPQEVVRRVSVDSSERSRAWTAFVRRPRRPRGVCLSPEFRRDSHPGSTNQTWRHWGFFAFTLDDMKLAKANEIVRADSAVCTGATVERKDRLGHPPKQSLCNRRKFGRSAGGLHGSALPGRIIIRPGLRGRSCRSGAVWCGRMTARDHVRSFTFFFSLCFFGHQLRQPVDQAGLRHPGRALRA